MLPIEEAAIGVGRTRRGEGGRAGGRDDTNNTKGEREGSADARPAEEGCK
jgi:hypothetical protein